MGCETLKVNSLPTISNRSTLSIEGECEAMSRASAAASVASPFPTMCMRSTTSSTLLLEHDNEVPHPECIPKPIAAGFTIVASEAVLALWTTYF
jgi:hypothetical protein